MFSSTHNELVELYVDTEFVVGVELHVDVELDVGVELDVDGELDVGVGVRCEIWV